MFKASFGEVKFITDIDDLNLKIMEGLFLWKNLEFELILIEIKLSNQSFRHSMQTKSRKDLNCFLGGVGMIKDVLDIQLTFQYILHNISYGNLILCFNLILLLL